MAANPHDQYGRARPHARCRDRGWAPVARVLRRLNEPIANAIASGSLLHVPKHLALLAACLVAFETVTADSRAEFRFESVATLDEMGAVVRDRFPLGTPRDDLRRVFVTQGRATLKIHPQQSGVEKYLYDLNLCDYYVWRWNISADYDAYDRLKQAYVNGNPVFTDGTPKRIVPKVAEKGKKTSITRGKRPRPEAHKGETSLGFVLFDRDSDFDTLTDQAVIGAGPTRADPVDMGRLITYSDVDPWRSIFDRDDAERIVRYNGDCAEVDKYYQRNKPSRAK